MFVVILDVSINGASFRTTEDVIEADSPAEAEAKLIEQWKRAEPTFTFRPLLTMIQPDGDRAA
jgi:hypothetical protein